MLNRRPTQKSGQGSRWWHAQTDNPPARYPYGPLEGNQKQLVSWMWTDGTQDYRRLERKAKGNTIWVRRQHARHFEVWFSNQQDYARARQRQGALLVEPSPADSPDP